jgi:hypothetical protein
MAKRVGRLSALVLIGFSGCVSLDGALASLNDAVPTVASNPFNTTPQSFTETTVNHAPASDEVSKRVAVAGQKIVAMNSGIGSPRFLTIGSPDLEIMHLGANDLYITEGLANRCTTEGQLAAVLCLELGKMVAQREILTTPGTRQGQHEPPPEVRVGGDSGGAFGSPDMTRFVELAEYEKKHPQRNDPVPPPPDPDILGRGYLEKAGYKLTDLDAVAPLLREAEANGKLYRQLQSSQPAALPGR